MKLAAIFVLAVVLQVGCSGEPDIDKFGTTRLIYQLAVKDRKNTADVMDQMLAAVKRRLDPAGTEQITVRKSGNDRIEIIIPGADPEVVADKKRLMSRLGSLEYALLANKLDHGLIIRKARTLGPGSRDLREACRIVASWREVGLQPDGKPKKVDASFGQVVTRTGRDGDALEFLVIIEKENRRIRGDLVSRAFETTDENGRPAVGFIFNTPGTHRMAQLTRDNKPASEGGCKRRLAILLDDRIHSAPNILEEISGGLWQITGSFTKAEVQELVRVLNAGAFPISTAPTLISSQNIR